MVRKGIKGLERYPTKVCAILAGFMVCYSCGIHGETGISYGIDKPILILKDKNVSLGGLPSYLAKSKPTIQLEFDPNDLHDCQP
jgi:hypothetical protein